MLNFNSKHDTKIPNGSQNNMKVKILPGHPPANTVEMVIKPLVKAIKIGHLQNKNEAETLNLFLVNYRDTPHLSTGVTPAHMLFRDGNRSNLPCKPISKEVILSA